ncbi:MAG: hypothetical protein HC914_20650 [Chloroflexaceae bacterium]|nr:hypothetical protein [Chloroflexaceae bacterium]
MTLLEADLEAALRATLPDPDKALAGELARKIVEAISSTTPLASLHPTLVAALQTLAGQQLVIGQKVFDFQKRPHG